MSLSATSASQNALRESSELTRIAISEIYCSWPYDIFPSLRLLLQRVVRIYIGEVLESKNEIVTSVRIDEDMIDYVKE